MSNIFLSSDLHLSHSNILTFKRTDNTALRSFDNITEHDEFIIEQHNKVVGQGDRWYCLGDLTFHNKYLHLVGRMNGRKILIKGNHDNLKLSQYAEYFDDIMACHVLDKMILTHIPIHADSLGRFISNIHGHLHSNRVMTAFGSKIDERYYNVSMECLEDYTPISLEQLKKNLKSVLESSSKI